MIKLIPPLIRFEPDDSARVSSSAGGFGSGFISGGSAEIVESPFVQRFLRRTGKICFHKMVEAFSSPAGRAAGEGAVQNKGLTVKFCELRMFGFN